MIGVEPRRITCSSHHLRLKNALCLNPSLIVWDRYYCCCDAGLAAGLRFYNLNWDGGIFAHPDERSTVAF
jgi:hypothetical protein